MIPLNGYWRPAAAGLGALVLAILAFTAPFFVTKLFEHERSIAHHDVALNFIRASLERIENKIDTCLFDLNIDGDPRAVGGDPDGEGGQDIGAIIRDALQNADGLTDIDLDADGSGKVAIAIMVGAGDGGDMNDLGADVDLGEESVAVWAMTDEGEAGDGPSTGVFIAVGGPDGVAKLVAEELVWGQEIRANIPRDDLISFVKESSAHDPTTHDPSTCK